MKKLFSLVLITLLALGYTRAQVDTLLYETFASGIPTGWANGGTALGTPNPWVKWLYTHNGPRGAFDNGAGTITSPTAANGFLLFDSDSLDNGGHYDSQTGQPITADGPANAPQVVTLTTTAINITGTPDCRLQFYQYFLNFASTTVIGVSTDSVNWFLDTVNTSVAQGGGAGAITAKNSKVIVDLSPYIAQGTNTGKLYISFIMDANYYFWQIDDILVTSLPDYDLQATQAFGEKGTSGLFYGSIPLSQFTSTDSFLASATYTNAGSVTQTNINTDFTVYKGTTAVDSAFDFPGAVTLPYGLDTTVSPARQFGTNGIANYTVAVNVESSDSANFDLNANRDSIYFAVTDSVFSVANTLALGSGGYYLLETNEGTAFTIGNLYEVTDQDTVTSVTTALLGGTGETAVGTVVQASIYPVTLTSSTVSYNATSPQVTTFPTTLTAANLTTAGSSTVKAVSLKVNFASGSAILTPGVYWVAMSAISSPDSDVVIATTATVQTGALGAVADPNAQNTLDPFNLSVPYVNLNFGHAASLLYANWSRNPSTSPIKAGTSVTFTGSSNGDNASVYTWTFYSDSDQYYFPDDTGRQVTTSFPGSGTDVSGKDAVEVCVTVTDNGASATYCNTVLVRPIGVGINEITQLTDVTLVPNPTTGNVNISANGINGTVSVSVENMLGEVVSTYEGDANGSFSKNFDLSALSTGLYLVRITNGGAAVTKKLSISK